MKRPFEVYVFRTTLRNDADIASIAPAFDLCRNVKSWSVDLEDWERVLRVVAFGLTAGDITLPSRMHLRCQFADRHRLSLGGVLSNDMFYCKPNSDLLPQTALYRNTTVKGELAYEYIVSSHFYFIARGGASKPIKSGYYKTSRKGDGDGNPLIEYTAPITPFFYLGFSYNLFR